MSYTELIVSRIQKGKHPQDSIALVLAGMADEMARFNDTVELAGVDTGMNVFELMCKEVNSIGSALTAMNEMCAPVVEKAIEQQALAQEMLTRVNKDLDKED